MDIRELTSKALKEEGDSLDVLKNKAISTCVEQQEAIDAMRGMSIKEKVEFCLMCLGEE